MSSPGQPYDPDRTIPDVTSVPWPSPATDDAPGPAGHSDPSHRAGRARRTGRERRTGCGCGVAAGVMVLVVLVGLVGGIVWLRANEYIQPTPLEPRCRLSIGDATTVLDPEQAHYAGIIVGRAVARGLPPRAGSIAMATAYQESGIRNLDYGDRDSVGLFQQRPSQGWGSRDQILDPYYATDAFYTGLVKVDGWQTGDITTVAQTVQRSGHPEAYRKHEQNARTIASVLSGQTPAGVTCGYQSPSAADPSGLATSMRRALGVTAKVSADGTTLTATGTSDEQAWAIASHAVVNANTSGVSTVTLGDRQWQWAAGQLPEWTTVTATGGARTVTVTFLAPSGSATPRA
ncbi:hypothetical protein [Raineyella sp. LH-20]|uniref:hypothetical protein n=1 Tax=Raineyella sp. LH-20 TaxID=3081204 RepID=UPI002953DB35|nr:hypothetical protein [Raineyella sp. LH-20]WOP17545.1 hypothetical protein R0146_09680 [Raineyella sp. LH-20]